MFGELMWEFYGRQINKINESKQHRSNGRSGWQRRGWKNHCAKTEQKQWLLYGQAKAKWRALTVHQKKNKEEEGQVIRLGGGAKQR